MERIAYRPTFAQSGCRFEEDAVLGGLSVEGEWLLSACDDPQIALTPVEPVPRGWCRFLLRGAGDLRNPRLYLDFGEGLSEAWSVPLDRLDGTDGFLAAIYLPSPVLRIRLDPADMPGRLRLDAFHVEPFVLGQAAAAMGGGSLAPQAPFSRALGSLAALLRTGNSDGSGDTGDEGDANALLFTGTRSHLSGISARLAPTYLENQDLVVELHALAPGGTRLLRSVTVPARLVGTQEWEHVYWPPVEASIGRVFLARFRARKNGRITSLSRAKVLLAAKPFHSNPDPHQGPPQAILFSPVTQCNLNCTHCISRPTRKRLAVAPERAWEALRAASRGPRFKHVALDYSGDMLFNELRHGGLLSRIIALDVPYRMDTNANCLEDDIIERLVGSRLVEINFSLDSMDPGTYRQIRRGSLPLEEVLGKIARFMRRRNEAAPAIRTVISFVLMRSNAATIAPAFEFAHRHGIDFVSLVPLIAFTPDMVEEILVTDDEAYRTLHAQCVRDSARTGVGLNMQAPVARWRDDDGHAPCELPWGTTTLLGNGDVMACCVPGTKIGNLGEGDFETIWNGPAYRAFRARVNTPDPPAPCRNCPMSRLPGNRKAYMPAAYPASPASRPDD